MNNTKGIYSASIVTVSKENAPADPAIEDVAAPGGVADRDFAYEEWVDDCERMALDTQGDDAEDDAAYYLSPDSTIDFK
jgi:hypothetical protein